MRIHSVSKVRKKQLFFGQNFQKIVKNGLETLEIVHKNDKNFFEEFQDFQRRIHKGKKQQRVPPCHFQKFENSQKFHKGDYKRKCTKKKK